MVKKPSTLPRSFLSVRRLLRRSLSGRHCRRTTSATARTPVAPPQDKLHARTVIVDVEGWLLKSPLSTFPYFMLIAVEAGSFLRGFLLLLMYPFLLCLSLHSGDLYLKAMVMVSFFGLREKEVIRISKAVLPKFFLEEVTVEGLEAFKKAGTVVAVTMAFPRVMVEGSLKEYLGVRTVVGREITMVAGRYLGFLEEEETSMERVGAMLEEMDEMKSKGDGAVGLVAMGSRMHHVFSHYCKVVETYALCEAEKTAWQALPRDKYPKRLVFHDGRLAFKPTFFAAVAMYTFLPCGIFLAVFRSAAFGLLPYRISVPLSAFTGMRSRLIAGPPSSPDSDDDDNNNNNKQQGRLYVCNHRTLLDPITVAAGLNKPVTAVTYSVSPVSELIAPIRTARLTRDRNEDRRRMEDLLSRGDLVVCPEGTTCREPYLLRFSPLFAELTGEVNPVALETRVDMFYGTSTKPAAKWMDPFYFMMNSRPEYRVEFLERVVVVTDPAQEGGHKGHSIQVANRVQRVLAEALQFKPTQLTRKDKYMVLAGNEGVVG
ncbi:hypothetical protein PR202_gb24469 [Eleusine coracana subsp. coracana]|uniref:Phospholipid/glycerol acyltransferase domain-containing protein n=1 Tax=Eleusine coracana subsp. coracana TaxID=191504 RepID=A0AAV5FLG8_ELECO|nr:hypothetical protein QOZ80_5BG0448830 [Eleusine coracana subsp. coracana]GJN35674.1 hypothetical protein PR202_gb24469 [Eleusine coracana subsp. coracana]